jgi:ribosomal protein L33
MTATRPARDELGIRCPRCGCRHFYTTNTEPLRDGRIRRRKFCRHCGRKVVTFETILAAGDGRDRQM